MFYLTKRVRFSASHRLHSPELTDAENREVYGLCNNPNGHGHNWVVEVTVRGELHEASGMVMDLNRLRLLVMEKLIARVDHLHLNHDVPFLAGVVPTAENIARAFWRELEPEIEGHEGCRLHRIRVRESRNNYVDYTGPARPPRKS